jgi:hypothetical protein
MARAAADPEAKLAAQRRVARNIFLYAPFAGRIAV